MAVPILSQGGNHSNVRERHKKPKMALPRLSHVLTLLIVLVISIVALAFSSLVGSFPSPLSAASSPDGPGAANLVEQ